MNTDVKTLWVVALRSGDYKQGTQTLRVKGADGDEFCCLGVLCDLARRMGVEVEVAERPSVLAGNTLVTYNNSSSYLPEVVRVWAGLDVDNPLAGEYRLGQWNDRVKADFNRIADLIDEHL